MPLRASVSQAERAERSRVDGGKRGSTTLLSGPELQASRAKVEKQRAVIERIRKHVRVWLQDKRMRITGQMLLAKIDRIEMAARARARGGA